MDGFDFSRFSQDVLKSIETAANIAVGFNTNIVMPCHLVGGLASVRGEEVYAFLENEGYDPDASLNSIAEGMSNVPFVPDQGGMCFHPEVEEVFARAYTSTMDTISVKDIMRALVNSNSQALAPYLVSSYTEELPVRNLNDDHTGATIRQFCVNMLQQAADGKIHHAIGRDEEVNRVLLILARSSKNNPVLVGPPGTGKTAIAEELAIRLYKNEVPQALANLKLYSLDFTSIKTSQDCVGVHLNLFR